LLSNIWPARTATVCAVWEWSEAVNAIVAKNAAASNFVRIIESSN
jgi:hypothetical protein